MGIIGIDQLTKVIAKATLKDKPPIIYLNDLWRWQYAENEGAFLSLGSGLDEGTRTLLLALVPSLFLVGLSVYLFIAKDLGKPESLAMALLISGGLSNVIDRICYGKVIDFMNLGIGDIRTGIFNVADMAIMAAFGVLVAIYWKNRKKPIEIDKKTETDPVEADPNKETALADEVSS